MLIAARNGMLADGGLSAKSYVQDGLVAHWDSIENAGYGDHNPTATKWKDISGKAYDFNVPSTLSWSNDALVFPQYGNKITNRLITNHSLTQHKTIEIIAKFTKNNGSILRIVDSNTIICHWEFQFFWNGSLLWAPLGQVNKRHYAALCIDDNGWRAYLDNRSNNGASILTPRGETSFTVGYYPSTTYAFYGEVCAIRFYDRPLTAEEIAHNYEIDKARFNLP